MDPAVILAALLRDEDEALAAAARLGLPVEALASWRSMLVDSGLAVLADRLQPVSWVQADLTLSGSIEQYARLIQGPLIDHLMEWTATGIAHNAWFLNKPPGIRLRLEGDPQRLRSLLGPLLDEVVTDRAAAQWRFGSYLPECHLFGGAAGTALAHRFFTADSLAALAFHRMRFEHTAKLGPAEFSFIVLDSCLTRLVPDAWERWDVWCRLRWTGRVVEQYAPEGSAAPRLPDDALAWVRALRSFPGPWPGASAEEQTILADYQYRIDELARETARAVETGEPAANVRRSLPFWIVFHWNRMFFSLEAQRAITHVVVAALDPRGPEIA